METAKSKYEDPIDWNTASFEAFQARQHELRTEFRASIPFVHINNYTEGETRQSLFRKAGFDANISVALEGVSVYVETEEELKNLQKVATENGLKIKMTQIFKGHY